MIQINTELPSQHWKFINVQNKIVLDLGCGRWEKVEYRDPERPTTPEYWIKQGAIQVIGVDFDPQEITWFQNNLNDKNKYIFLLKDLSHITEIAKLIWDYKPNVVKCDIEGHEINLLNLEDSLFTSVEEYYIETHNSNLHQMWIEKLKKLHYKIIEEIDLTHTHGACKVIFATK